MTTANTKDCWRECIGHTIRGVLFDAFPSETGRANKAFVLDDGRAIVVSSSGAFWMESAADTERAISRAREALVAAKRDLADVLLAAGELDVE